MENGKSNGGATAKLPEIKFTKLFINGQFLDAVSGFFPFFTLNFTASNVDFIAEEQIIQITPFLILALIIQISTLNPFISQIFISDSVD